MCSNRNALSAALLAAVSVAFLPGQLSALECRPVASLNYFLLDQAENIPAGKPPFLGSVKKVEKRQNFNIYFILRGLKTHGKDCKIVADIKIVRPDGKLCFKSDNAVMLAGPVATTLGAEGALSPQFVKVALEDSDPLGQYVIKVTAVDQIGKDTASAETAVELVSAAEDFLPLDFADAKAQQLITYFYLQPQPEKLIPLYLGYCKLYREKLFRNPRHNPLIPLAFFYNALALNRQLLPQLADAGKDLDPICRNFTIMLLHYLKVDDAKIYERIGAAQAVGFRKLLADQTNPFDVERPNSPLQEDILWSQFFATGLFQPVKMIAEAMTAGKQGISLEEFRKIKQPTDAERQKLLQWLVGEAARWSLASNAKQHVLVRFYCETLLARNQAAPELSKYLREVLTDNAAKVTTQAAPAVPAAK